jgi:hypothetical protein
LVARVVIPADSAAAGTHPQGPTGRRPIRVGAGRRCIESPAAPRGVGRGRGNRRGRKRDVRRCPRLRPGPLQKALATSAAGAFILAPARRETARGLRREVRGDSPPPRPEHNRYAEAGARAATPAGLCAGSCGGAEVMGWGRLIDLPVEPCDRPHTHDCGRPGGREHPPGGGAPRQPRTPARVHGNQPSPARPCRRPRGGADGRVPDRAGHQSRDHPRSRPGATCTPSCRAPRMAPKRAATEWAGAGVR